MDVDLLQMIHKGSRVFINVGSVMHNLLQRAELYFKLLRASYAKFWCNDWVMACFWRVFQDGRGIKPTFCKTIFLVGFELRCPL